MIKNKAGIDYTPPREGGDPCGFLTAMTPDEDGTGPRLREVTGMAGEQ
jgi:hypothetical protein